MTSSPCGLSSTTASLAKNCSLSSRMTSSVSLAVPSSSPNSNLGSSNAWSASTPSARCASRLSGLWGPCSRSSCRSRWAPASTSRTRAGTFRNLARSNRRLQSTRCATTSPQRAKSARARASRSIRASAATTCSASSVSRTSAWRGGTSAPLWRA
ncbi:hypothetical protein DMC30DRAFT_149834 [Rhodotorula diobovata]|uniref:Uncharacterized protein n=1 Tax=Rhodotorula diobovata TaxID=5288 RepID=A0A5C5FM05_9BASI|nr:hypothetical protein DMC30DRAFT_149834 [Rhodotorula diobovata]